MNNDISGSDQKASPRGGFYFRLNILPSLYVKFMKRFIILYKIHLSGIFCKSEVDFLAEIPISRGNPPSEHDLGNDFCFLKKFWMHNDVSGSDQKAVINQIKNAPTFIWNIFANRS